MPFVTIQIGQCGNQLGATWFNTLAEELSAANNRPMTVLLDPTTNGRHEQYLWIWSPR
eukprot:gene12600-12732_t